MLHRSFQTCLKVQKWDMNFIGRHLNAIGLLLLVSFASAAGALYWDVPKKIKDARAATKPKVAEACVVHMAKPAATAAAESSCTRAVAATGAKEGCCSTEVAPETTVVESSCCGK
jgi:hypothetical protein